MRAWGKARLPFRVSRYGVKLQLEPTSLGITPRRFRQEGFPDMSRIFTTPHGAAGQVLDLPDKELRYLRQVSPVSPRGLDHIFPNAP